MVHGLRIGHHHFGHRSFHLTAVVPPDCGSAVQDLIRDPIQLCARLPSVCSRPVSSVERQPELCAGRTMTGRFTLGADGDCGQPRRDAVLVGWCPVLTSRPLRGEAIASAEVRVPATAPAAEFQLWPTSVCLRLSAALTRVSATKANAIGRRIIGRYVSRCEGA